MSRKIESMMRVSFGGLGLTVKGAGRRGGFVRGAVAAAVVAVAVPALGQTSYTWSVSTGSAWFTATNWNPNTAFPGAQGNAAPAINNTDIALFSGTSVSGNSLGINFNAATNNQLNLGAINFNNAVGSTLNIGNSSTVADGILRLNGASIDPGTGTPISNMLVSISSAATQNLTITNGASGGTRLMGVSAPNGGTLYSSTGRTLTMNATVTGGTLTKAGQGILTIGAAATNTFTGFTLQEGTVNLGGASTFNASRQVLASPLGTGTVTLSGGTLAGNSNYGFNAVVINGDVTIGAAANTQRLGIGAPIDLAGATRTLTISRDAGSFANAIASNQGLRLDNAGTAPNLSPQLSVSNGSLRLAAGAGVTTYAGFLISQTTAFNNNAGLIIGDKVAFTSTTSFVFGTNAPVGVPTMTIEGGGVWALSGVTSHNPSVFSLSGAGTVASAQAAVIAHSITINGTGTGDFSGRLIDGPAATTAGLGTFASTLAVTKSGTGLQVLSGTNSSYGGTTTIQGGVLRAGNNAAGIPSSSGIVLSGGILEFNGTLARNVGSGAGNITNTASGGYSAFGGPATLTLSGGATLNWSATFANNTLTLNNDTANSTLTVTNPIDTGSTNRTIAVNANTVVMTGAITGSGLVTKNGPGTLVYANDVTTAAGSQFTLNGGIIQIGNGGTTGSFGGGISGNAAGTSVVFNRSDTYNHAFNLLGSAAVNQIGTGTVVATGGVLSFSGPLTISAGTWQVSNGLVSPGNATNGGTGVGALVIAGNAALVINRGNTFNLGNTSISGAGSILVNNVAVNTNVNFTNTATGFTGLLTVQRGIFTLGGALGDGGDFGSAAGISLGATGTFIVQRTTDYTLANNVSGEGTLTKTQANTVTLTGAVTHTGNVNVNAGALVLGPATGLSAKVITVATGARFEPLAAYPIGLTLASNQTLVANGTVVSPTILNDGRIIYNAAVDGTISNNILGSGSLQRVGLSTLTLTGNNSFSGPISNNNPGTINFQHAAPVSYPGGISGTGSVVHSGTSVLTLGGALIYTGDTLVTGNGATLNLQSPLRPVTGSLVVTGPGASAILAATNTTSTYTRAGEFASIQVGPTASVVLASTARNDANASVLVTTGLSIDGFVDLGNNDLIVRGAAAAVSTIRGLVSAWLATPGTGLGSTATDANTTLAVFPNVAAPTVAYFDSYDGVLLTADDVIVKYTYKGDTNLDGVLDSTDLVNIIEGLSLGLTGWENGDTNYDGVVNTTDLNAFLTAQGSQVYGPLGGGQGNVDGGGAIPEPSSLGLLALAVPALSRRRRSR